MCSGNDGIPEIFRSLSEWMYNSFIYMSPASLSFSATLWLQADSSNEKPMMYCSTKMHSNLCNYLVITSHIIPISFVVVYLNGEIIIE